MIKSNIEYEISGVVMTPSTWGFPAGEVGVSINDEYPDLSGTLINISASLTSSDDIMGLLMLTDSLKRTYPESPIALILGYVPYGRQDRVCNTGESLSIKVFADLINSQDYSSVTIHDPHSDVTSAVINNCNVISQKDVFNSLFAHRFEEYERDVIIAPDAGAFKKVLDIYNDGQFKELMTASKVRDLKTGNITSFNFTGDVKDKHCVVIDDIVDGGATFILIGEALKEAGAKSISLCATHGIFSKGHEVIADLYDNVYTTNSYHFNRRGLIESINYIKLI